MSQDFLLFHTASDEKLVGAWEHGKIFPKHLLRQSPHRRCTSTICALQCHSHLLASLPASHTPSLHLINDSWGCERLKTHLHPHRLLHLVPSFVFVFLPFLPTSSRSDLSVPVRLAINRSISFWHAPRSAFRSRRPPRL